MNTEEYYKYITKPLNNNKIIKFSKELEKKHTKMHTIMPIPAKFSILDALCYIFDNNPDHIASVLQDNYDNLEHALQLF